MWANSVKTLSRSTWSCFSCCTDAHQLGWCWVKQTLVIFLVCDDHRTTSPCFSSSSSPWSLHSDLSYFLPSLSAGSLLGSLPVLLSRRGRALLACLFPRLVPICLLFTVVFFFPVSRILHVKLFPTERLKTSGAWVPSCKDPCLGAQATSSRCPSALWGLCQALLSLWLPQRNPWALSCSENINL